MQMTPALYPRKSVETRAAFAPLSSGETAPIGMLAAVAVALAPVLFAFSLLSYFWPR